MFIFRQAIKNTIWGKLNSCKKYVVACVGVVLLHRITYIMFVALPYLLKHLLDTKGLAFTLQIESDLVATTILCALVFKPLIKREKKVDDVPNHR